MTYNNYSYKSMCHPMPLAYNLTSRPSVQITNNMSESTSPC